MAPATEHYTAMASYEAIAVPGPIEAEAAGRGGGSPAGGAAARAHGPATGRCIDAYAGAASRDHGAAEAVPGAPPPASGARPPRPGRMPLATAGSAGPKALAAGAVADAPARRATAAANAAAADLVIIDPTASAVADGGPPPALHRWTSDGSTQSALAPSAGLAPADAPAPALHALGAGGGGPGAWPPRPQPLVRTHSGASSTGGLSDLDLPDAYWEHAEYLAVSGMLASTAAAYSTR